MGRELALTSSRGGVVASLAGLAAYIIKTVVRLGWRYRWQLVPLYVATGTILTGWAAVILHRTTGPLWLAAGCAVALLCAAVWMYRLTPGYQRTAAVITTAACSVAAAAVAINPRHGATYGMIFLLTPMAGLAWWCGPTMRSILLAAKFRKKFDQAAKIVSLKATLIAVRLTPVGRVATTRLEPGETADAIHTRAFESALDLRPGAMKVEPSKTRARIVDLHLTEKDPWKEEIQHPAYAVLNNNKAA